MALLVDEHGNVEILGRRKAEHRLQVDVRRSGIEQVDAAHDRRHALHRVVEDDGQVIGRQAVAAHDDEVAERRAEVRLDLAL